MILAGCLIITIICVCVKLFDSTIRGSHWMKVCVNTSTILGLLLIVVGIIRIIIGG